DLACFGLGVDMTGMRSASRDNDTLWSSRQELVVSAFRHAWKGYSDFAFGKDEYYPTEKRGESFIQRGIGFTIVDSLDTMILMGLKEEYAEARQWVENELTFQQDGM
ncbi:Endoplasmic reticulum mannosyl-oligosaccharide 1,2-alpha-mannosidase, partial [Massospora cicadina]